MNKKPSVFAAMLPVGMTLVKGVYPPPEPFVQAYCPGALESQCFIRMPRLPSVPSESQPRPQAFYTSSGTGLTMNTIHIETGTQA